MRSAGSNSVVEPVRFPAGRDLCETERTLSVAVGVSPDETRFSPSWRRTVSSGDTPTATASYCTHGGFTLIEILVALAIVAIALGAVVAESSHYIASMVRMQDRTIAHWVAMDRITEQQLLGTWPGPNESNGSVHLAGRDWHWSMRIIATPDDSIRRVDVDVSADDHRDRVDATAIAYLERPAQ